MGSQLVTALTEQIGSLETNDGTSKPIEQRVTSISTSSYSKPIEQFREMQTDEATGGFGSTSKPIEQIYRLRYPAEWQALVDGAFVEQCDTKRNTANIDTPIEQLVFNATSESMIQQNELERQTAYAQPIEQVVDITNSVQVTQFDFATLIFPPCNSIKNPVNTNILWRIRDNGFPFDVDSLIFRVDNTEVQDTPEFSVTVIANGLQLDYNPPVNFEYNTQVSIYLYIEDTDSPPNGIEYACDWYTVPDTKAPVVSLVSPVCGETGVDVLEPVVFDVLDLGNGVDPSSITLSIEGLPVCDGLSFDAISVPTSGTGYRGTWVHVDDPFRYESNITVSVTAADLAESSNSVFFVCDFDVEQSSEPEFININPAPCASFVDNTTGLTFEVYGDVDGVDISTLEVRVDSKLRKVFVRPKVLRS
jgi:hypothetical protein